MNGEYVGPRLDLLLALAEDLEDQGSVDPPKGVLATENEPESRSAVSGGVQLILAGAAVALVGILYKFGEAEGSFDENNIVTIEEKSYNSANYALMGIGGAMVLGGLVLESGGPSAGVGVEEPPKANALTGLSFSPAIGARVAF